MYCENKQIWGFHKLYKLWGRKWIFTQLLKNIRDADHLIIPIALRLPLKSIFSPKQKKEENSYFWMNEQTNERSKFVLLSYNPT